MRPALLPTTGIGRPASILLDCQPARARASTGAYPIECLLPMPKVFLIRCRGNISSRYCVKSSIALSGYASFGNFQDIHDETDCHICLPKPRTPGRRCGLHARHLQPRCDADGARQTWLLDKSPFWPYWLIRQPRGCIRSLCSVVDSVCNESVFSRDHEFPAVLRQFSVRLHLGRAGDLVPRLQGVVWRST